MSKSTSQVLFSTNFDLSTFRIIKNSFLVLFKIKYPEEFFTDVFQRRYRSILGLEKETKELMCFSHIQIDKPSKTAKIVTFGVLPEFQGKKIGTQLLNKVIEELRIIGIYEVSLMVQSSNEGAIRMYLKNNFKVEREIDNYYNLGEESENRALEMKRSLKEDQSDGIPESKTNNNSNWLVNIKKTILWGEKEVEFVL